MLNAKDLELLAAKGMLRKRIPVPGNYGFGLGGERNHGDPAGKTGDLYGCLGCLSGKE